MSPEFTHDSVTKFLPAQFPWIWCKCLLRILIHSKIFNLTKYRQVLVNYSLLVTHFSNNQFINRILGGTLDLFWQYINVGTELLIHGSPYGQCLTLWTLRSKFEFSFVALLICYRSSGEKLIKYQENSSWVIMSVILMTTLFYKALILQGEIWCWSLLGLKGLKGNVPKCFTFIW